MNIAQNLNTLAAFLGPRDIAAPTPDSLMAFCGLRKADAFVLFGGSILAGADALAEAMRSGLARTYIIVGGEGHTTAALRARVHAQYPEIEVENTAEADVFAAYLRRKYALSPDHLERASTNCGNNITNLLALAKERGIPLNSAILCQDATMQLRMDAGLRKHAPATRVVNYAAYRARVVEQGEHLAYEEPIPGMWDIERYITLLLGEIPRLTDDEHGYGPRGRDYIAHVEIPAPVRAAFEALRRHFTPRS